MQDKNDLDLICMNTIRSLSKDALQAANSGHPGTPMGKAPVAYCLWQQFLCFDLQDPVWPNRDRFVPSAGHASILMYALHLTGLKAVSKDYEAPGEPSVPLDAIKHFRQLDSRCPGHPEYHWTGHSLGMRSFGAMAPLKDLQKKFGFTSEAVAQAARQQLGRSARQVRG